LERLEKRGYIYSYITEPIPEKGGRKKRVYCITDIGKNALFKSREVQKSMWDHLPAISFKR
jgi:DNA-binding PadR family transcriptional regulator